MRNRIIAALAALALLGTCSCAEPDAPEKSRDTQSAVIESEDAGLSADADLDAGDAATTPSETKKTAKTPAKAGTGTDTETDAASDDDNSVDGDDTVSGDGAENDASNGGGSDLRADTGRSGASTTSRSDGSQSGSGSSGTVKPRNDTPSQSAKDPTPETTRSQGGSSSGRKDGQTTRDGQQSADTKGSSDASTPTTPSDGGSGATVPADSAKTPETDAPEQVIAEPAPSYPLRSGAAASGDANDHNVPFSEIVEGAGPLGSAGIYVGANDFMFYGECIADLSGENLLSDMKLKRFADVMNERDSWAKQNGIELIFVIAPNKATVYSDYVPASVTRAQSTRCDQVVEYLAANSSVRVVDLRRTLKNARAAYGDDLFYLYDTHWNQNGGFVAYGAIMNEVLKTRPNAVKYGADAFNVNRYETYMKDNAWYLGWYDAFTDYGPVYSLKAGPDAKLLAKSSNGTVGGQYNLAYRWPNGYRDDMTYLYYKSKNTSAPNLYMYQDSFGIALMPFLKESFAEANFEWSHMLSKRNILEMEADTLIIEVAEKGLGDFIKYHAFY